MVDSATRAAMLAPARLVPLLITLGIGVIIWLMPPPEGVTQEAWHLLAIFVATIVGIITKPLPMGAVAIIGVAATALTGTLKIGDALSGFGNNTVWLIGVAFFVSRAIIKTGLGARIALHFMKRFGKELFTGAGLTGNEHIGIAVGCTGQGIHTAFQQKAATNDPLPL